MAPRRRGDRAPRVVGGRVREPATEPSAGLRVFIVCVVACRRGGAVDVEGRRRGEAAPRMPCQLLRCMVLLCTRRFSSYASEFRRSRELSRNKLRIDI